MNIEYWRAEIDEVDREILRLLNRRARLAMKVGVLKRASGLPCCDPDREAVVLAQLQQANTGPLAPHSVTTVFSQIMRESRRLEESEPAKTETSAKANATQSSLSKQTATRGVLL